MIDSIESSWSQLRQGICLPEYGVNVPWLITQEDLESLVPADAITFSEGGEWPQIEFTLLGFHARLDFNFVSDPSGRLDEVQFMSYHPRKLKRSFRRSATLLLQRLGRPNVVDHSHGQQFWRRDGLVIQNHISRFGRGDNCKWSTAHFLSIRTDHGTPDQAT